MDELDATAEKFLETPHTCMVCNKAYLLDNLISQKLDATAEQILETPHTCMICNKAFQNSSNLNDHIRRLHKQPTYHPNPKQVKCSLCTFTTTTARQLIRHLESVHEVSILEEKHSFLSEDAFVKWKEEIEKETMSSYVKNYGAKKYGNKQLIYLDCHRSGKFISTGRGKRNLKINGSNKMGSYCPSQMKIMKKHDGSIDVCFVKTHVGHSCDLEHIPPSKKERTQFDEQCMREKYRETEKQRRQCNRGKNTEKTNQRKQFGKNAEAKQRKQCNLEKNREMSKQRMKETFQNLQLRLENAKSQEELNLVNKLCLQVQAQLGATALNKQNVSYLSTQPENENANPREQANIKIVNNNLALNSPAAEEEKQMSVYYCIISEN